MLEFFTRRYTITAARKKITKFIFVTEKKFTKFVFVAKLFSKINFELLKIHLGVQEAKSIFENKPINEYSAFIHLY